MQINERNKNIKKINLKGCTCKESKHITSTASEKINSINTTTSNSSYQEKKSDIEIKNLKND